ncbi:hypothetical protein SDC9_102290 [bioreactor metagenome]|uniref:Uncharacterized protein n=1 Tax=bioreactor metagenome TaxID=1076179 RepID=A0A645AX52_9ZZZZ
MQRSVAAVHAASEANLRVIVLQNIFVVDARHLRDGFVDVGGHETRAKRRRRAVGIGVYRIRRADGERGQRCNRACSRARKCVEGGACGGGRLNGTKSHDAQRNRRGAV